MQELHLKLKMRQLKGKKAKKIIEEGGVLGNVFGRGQESQSVQGDYQTVSKLISQAGKTAPIELEIEGGDNVLALVSGVERDTISGKIHHVEFHVIHRGEKVHTQTPIKFIGEAPAEKTGKIVVSMLDELEIEAIPSKLPEFIEISVDDLEEEGDSITVGDLKIPEGVELKTELDQMIARVEVPRAQIEEEPELEEEGEAGDVPSEHGGDDGESEDSDQEDDK